MASSNGRAGYPVSLVGPDADVGFYRRQVAQLGQPVLVLGCANGRLAWELCAQLPRVVAVDPSPLMIAFAEERRANHPFERASRVRFLSADLRSLRLSDKFAAVLAPQNALALMASIADLDAVFATAKHHLSPGGMLLFDAINPNRESTPATESRHEDAGAAPFSPCAHRSAFAPHLMERRRTGPVPSAAIRRLRLRQFYPSELDRALEEGGFVATARYGRYDEKPFDPDDPLQIVVASLVEG